MDRRNPNYNGEIGQHPDQGSQQIFTLIEQINQRLEQLQLEVLQQLEQQAMQQTGLTAERIKRFEHFNADESLVGEDCIVCLDELQIGTGMVRLDCHVNHYLCKKCTDAWFKDHKKCPLCNHVFN